jgi:23S rRNA (pseudouridine1915-N3)-methyltransferase
VRILIAAVGRIKPGPLHELQREYLTRLSWPVELREIEERRKLPPAEMKRRDGEALLAALPSPVIAVALDERGAAFGSAAFAERLCAWRDAGTPNLTFLIGGADGLDAPVRARADLLLAFGAMTWPHQLARIMLLEQLYRAQQIIAGHPYHRA